MQTLWDNVCVLHAQHALTTHAIDAAVKCQLRADSTFDLWFFLLTETNWDGSTVGASPTEYTEFVRNIAVAVCESQGVYKHEPVR